MRAGEAPWVTEYEPGELDQPGFFDESDLALPFFYARVIDKGCTEFLDRVSVGPTALEAESRSSYTATVRMDILEVVRPEESLTMGSAVTRIGGKSFNYRIALFRKSDGAMVADSHHVAVVMDMTGPSPIRIPDSVRSIMEGYSESG